jgi:predicted 2-oxoglutarate/Fe(II)-dependent dioxygenase YbiX
MDGKSSNVLDAKAKRRRDYLLQERDLIEGTRARILRRVVPEILKVHQFKVTRMERYVVACYAAEDGGHFSAHRDNTTKATAHRRFAVSINLNDDFEGGTVHFPEYGPRGYKIAAGGAVVFSCSLLHAVSKVTRGRRYAFLPFLYDEEGAQIRAENNPFLGENIAPYRQAPEPPAAADAGAASS